MQTDTAAIRTLLQVYRDLYRARDVARLDEAMPLFVPDGEAEMVGPEAVRRGGFAPLGPRVSTRWPARARCCRDARARRA